MTADTLSWDELSPTSGAIRMADRVEIARYHWPDDKPNAYFHPVRPTHGKAELTCHAPHDHPWHLGLWWSWKTINGVVFWEDNDPRNQGRQVVTEHNVDQSDGSVAISQSSRYVPNAEPSQTWMTEHRTITARTVVPGMDDAPRRNAWCLDWDLTWSASIDVELSVTPPITEQRWGGYMGLNYRPARSMAHHEHVFNSEGIEGGEYDLQQFESCHGRTARWACYAGKVDGMATGEPQGAGVATLDHPRNFRHPTPWYTFTAGPANQAFGFLSASPVMHEPYTMKQGDTLRLRYRTLLFGCEPDAQTIERAWQAYAGE